MCGIFACLGQCSEIKAKLLPNLAHRGPDCTGDAVIAVDGGRELHLLGCVLQMRGKITAQPFSSQGVADESRPRGNSLLWNGNVFGGVKIDVGTNDTVEMFHLLGEVEGVESLLSVLSSIHGPWAFVYWQECTQCLWFGRDVFGRRSLLWHLPTSPDDVLCLSSIGACDHLMPAGYWSEVPASCVHRLPLSVSPHSPTQQVICYPWMQAGTCFQSEESILEEFRALNTASVEFTLLKNAQLQLHFPPLNRTQPTEKPPLDWKCIAGEFLEILQKAVSIRVENAPDLACCLSHRADSATATPNTATHSTAATACSTSSAATTEATTAATTTTTTTPAAVEVACCGMAKFSSGELVYGRARVAVLYSGGVDSVVLAALVDRCLPVSEEIDLINVAFQENNPKTKQQSFAVPDRVSAIESLKDLNPERRWNLIQVDVTSEQLSTMRASHISQLIYPHDTVLDDSIGCALWFAARGRGWLYGGGEAFYLSQARTLFIGIGADEQLGGYSRHRRQFRSGGWGELLDELDKDIKRLSQRNLGRDDSNVSLIHFQMDLLLPQGVGEKRLLREVAELLGCFSAARVPKHAIQFGSRIAKLSGSSGGRRSGSDKFDMFQLAMN